VSATLSMLNESSSGDVERVLRHPVNVEVVSSWILNVTFKIPTIQHRMAAVSAALSMLNASSWMCAHVLCVIFYVYRCFMWHLCVHRKAYVYTDPDGHDLLSVLFVCSSFTCTDVFCVVLYVYRCFVRHVLCVCRCHMCKHILYTLCASCFMCVLCVCRCFMCVLCVCRCFMCVLCVMFYVCADV